MRRKNLLVGLTKLAPKWVALGIVSLIVVFSALLSAWRGLTHRVAPSGLTVPAPAKVDQSLRYSAPVQARSQSITSAKFRHIDLEEGLSQSSVLCILQDTLGFLWLGTQDGLNRYDGYNFIVYKNDPDNPDSLSDNWINSLAEDAEGNLWIGTQSGGLNRFDRQTGRFIRYQSVPNQPTSLIHNFVTTLLVDQEGALWVGTNGGLSKLDRVSGQFKNYPHDVNDPDSLLHKSVSTLYQDEQGNLWIGTMAGLDKFDRQSDHFIHYRPDPKNPYNLKNYIEAIRDDGSGTLWLGTHDGLFTFDPQGGSFTHLYQNDPSRPGSLINNDIQAIYQDREGILWIGTDAGLEIYQSDADQFIHFQRDTSDPFSLSDASILSFYEDEAGILWIGTFGGGVNLFDRDSQLFVHYQSDPQDPNSLNDNSIFAIMEDSQGIVWIGTYTGGLNRLDPKTGQITHYIHDPADPASLTDNTVLAILEDRQGNLWVGTCKGLDRYNPSTDGFIHYRRDPQDVESLSSNYVMALFQDSSGTLWIGTYGGGLNRIDPETGKFTSYQSDPYADDSLSGDVVLSIYEDRDGHLWIGTSNSGLNRFDRQKEQFVRYYANPDNPQSISSNTVISIYQDRQGRLWFGTSGKGLNLYHPDTDTFTRYTVKEGLPNEVVYGILEDDQGYLWLSTNKGLSKYNPSQVEFKNYDISDGLQSNEFNSGAYFRGASGQMYFGGVNGLNVFNPSQIKDDSYIPPVVLTSLTQGGVPVQLDKSVGSIQEIRLEWPYNYFEFEFAALSYAEPAENQYAYRLEDFDKDWNWINHKHNGKYTNLPGGTYTLRLKGSNQDGVWNEAGIELKVRVIPPFWSTWWFRGVAALVVIVGVLGGYRLRVKSIEARSQELEKLVSQRTSEIHQRNQEMQALYLADERMLRYVNLDQVLQTLVDVAVDMLGADKSSVFVWNDRRTKLSMRVFRGFNPESQSILCFSRDEGLLSQVAVRGEPLRIDDILSDPCCQNERPEIRECLQAEGIRSTMHLPIKIDHEIFGVFNVSSTRPGAFQDDEQRLFTALIQRATLSIENAQLFEQTKELAIIEERGRLARDLHDSAKQKAFAALAQLGAAVGIVEKKPTSAKKHLVEAENLVYDVLQELVFLIQEMYPLALQEKGLVTTLREYIFEWENRSDITVDFKVDGSMKLPLEVEQAIYRIVQESLANVARHSQASKVEVRLHYSIEAVSVAIADNGQGFEVEQKPIGLGLRSMRERAEMIHGTFQVNSIPGKGTEVSIVVPTNHKI